MSSTFTLNVIGFYFRLLLYLELSFNTIKRGLPLLIFDIL